MVYKELRHFEEYGTNQRQSRGNIKNLMIEIICEIKSTAAVILLYFTLSNFQSNMVILMTSIFRFTKQWWK